MKKVLVITWGRLDERLDEKMVVQGLDLEHVKPDALAAKELSQYEAVIWGAFNLTSDLLKKFTKARLFSFMGIGYASFIDEEYCAEKGIVIANTPGVNANAVAEFAVGLMLDAKRDITKINNQLKGGNTRRSCKKEYEIRSSTIGIAGFGHIGSRIAHICREGFGAEVIYTSRNEKENDFTFVSKDDLLRRSDVLFLCMDENPATVNYLTSTELAQMKDSAILINPARPHLVNGPDLYEALTKGTIRACAMDGYYSENPKCEADKSDYGLLELPDDLFLNTSHIGTFSQDALEAMTEQAVDNVIDFFAKA